MKNARISELRDGLSEYLARVREGEVIVVYDRDTPIARIEPMGGAADGQGQPAWVRDAIRRGVLTPPKVTDRAPLPPPVRTAKPARLLEALLDERRTGR